MRRSKQVPQSRRLLLRVRNVRNSSSGFSDRQGTQYLRGNPIGGKPIGGKPIGDKPIGDEQIAVIVMMAPLTQYGVIVVSLR